ncbi:hypothetical protein [Nocardioides solisilvae]|uniref:hypothetical protein n=1 Tax=Nocardioides solisilvae TaxID=1542435 RepID=UPI0013A5B29E|nr:hypothetical protein [Nocardioides solisilvae]
MPGQSRRRPSRVLTVVVAVWTLLHAFSLTLLLTDADHDGLREPLTGAAMVTVGVVVLWLVWRPRATPRTDHHGTAVARPVWWLRMAGLLAGVIGAVVLANALTLAVGADPPLDGAGRAAVAVLLCLVGLVLLGAAWVSWWLRQSIDPHEATVRVLGRTHRIRQASATAVRATTATLHAGRVGGKIPLTRILVEGPNQDGEAARAAFDATMTDVEQAAVSLDGWVRARPELVQDETTRLFFEARGVLTPTE